MTRIRFHQELDELKHRILAMAGMQSRRSIWQCRPTRNAIRLSASGC